MKRKATYRCLGLVAGVLLSANLSIAQTYSQCGASPDPITISQSNGTNLTIIGRGNSVIHYTETVDGYTVVQNSAGIYEYAERGTDGSLVSSGIVAHEPTERTASEMIYLGHTQPMLRMSKDKVQELLQKEQALTANKTSNINAKFPGKGKRKALILLIDYPNLQQKNLDTGFVSLMNKPNYKGTGSFRDYYLINSFNQLDITTDVYGWYHAKNPYEYYGRVNGDGRTRELGREAVDQAEAAGVDFSPYDNDGDGKVDILMLVHSGIGAEIGSQTKYIWSHQGSLGNQSRTYDGVTINDYMVQPEIYGAGLTGIGVFCHEFGHALGLPDLYDPDYTSEGVGEFSIMGGGPYLNGTKTPAGFCAWTKIDMDWCQPVVLNEDSLALFKTWTLKPANDNKDMYKIPTKVKGEYLLLENRQNAGYDKYIPGKGMLCWHIDSTLAVRFRKFGDNSINTKEAHKAVDLLEADGQDLLDKPGSRGDKGDPYPGTKNNTSITDNTYPYSSAYGPIQSGIQILNIVENADKTVSFGLKKSPCTTNVKAQGLTTFCNEGDSLPLVLTSPTPGSTVQWYKNGTAISGATANTLKVLETGSYIAEVTDPQGCKATTTSIKVNVNAIPPVPSISVNGNVLTSSATVGNQWILNGNNIPGGTQRNYTIKQSGNYSLMVTLSGCVSESGVKFVNFVGLAELSTDVFNIFPNPAHDRITVRVKDQQQLAKNLTVSLFDINGKEVLKHACTELNSTINISALTPGIYMMKADNTTLQKVIIY